MQFDRLIDFAIWLAERTASAEERPFVERMKRLRAEEFWPGRGLEIDSDLPDVAERKFWTRVFFDTARAIFERRVGTHEHHFWQAQTIHQAHAVGVLLEEAVRQVEPRWSADTLDRREFNEWVK